MIQLISMMLSSCASYELGIQTVPFVDLDKFSGLWYEQAHMPNPF
jgi:lipocalin